MTGPGDLWLVRREYGVVLALATTGDRDAELARLREMRRLDLLAEVFARLPRGACQDDVWLISRLRVWSRDKLITELLPPYRPAEKKVAA